MSRSIKTLKNNKKQICRTLKSQKGGAKPLINDLNGINVFKNQHFNPALNIEAYPAGINVLGSNNVSTQYENIKGQQALMEDMSNYLNPIFGCIWSNFGLIDNHYCLDTGKLGNLIRVFFTENPGSETIIPTQALLRTSNQIITPYIIGKYLICKYMTKIYNEDDKNIRALQSKIHSNKSATNNSSIKTDSNFNYLYNKYKIVLGNHIELNTPSVLLDKIKKHKANCNFKLITIEKYWKAPSETKNASDYKRFQNEYITEIPKILTQKKRDKSVHVSEKQKKTIGRNSGSNASNAVLSEDSADITKPEYIKLPPINGNLEGDEESTTHYFNFTAETDHSNINYYHIFLAILWCIANNKQGLIEYYQGVNSEIFNYLNLDGLNVPKFSKQDINYTGNFENRIAYLYRLDKANLELYEQEQIRLPQLIKYTDCGETSVLNFIKILAWDDDKMRISFTKLKTLGLRPHVIKFFKTYNKIGAGVGQFFEYTLPMKKAWNLITNNIPNVKYTYKQLITTTDNSIIEYGTEIDAGICAPEKPNMFEIIKYLFNISTINPYWDDMSLSYDRIFEEISKRLIYQVEFKLSDNILQSGTGYIEIILPNGNIYTWYLQRAHFYIELSKKSINPVPALSGLSELAALLSQSSKQIDKIKSNDKNKLSVVELEFIDSFTSKTNIIANVDELIKLPMSKLLMIPDLLAKPTVINFAEAYKPIIHANPHICSEPVFIKFMNYTLKNYTNVCINLELLMQNELYNNVVHKQLINLEKHVQIHMKLNKPPRYENIYKFEVDYSQNPTNLDFLANKKIEKFTSLTDIEQWCHGGNIMNYAQYLQKITKLTIGFNSEPNLDLSVFPNLETLKLENNQYFTIKSLPNKLTELQLIGCELKSGVHVPLSAKILKTDNIDIINELISYNTTSGTPYELEQLIISKDIAIKDEESLDLTNLNVKNLTFSNIDLYKIHKIIPPAKLKKLEIIDLENSKEIKKLELKKFTGISDLIINNRNTIFKNSSSIFNKHIYSDDFILDCNEIANTITNLYVHSINNEFIINNLSSLPNLKFFDISSNNRYDVTHTIHTLNEISGGESIYDNIIEPTNINLSILSLKYKENLTLKEQDDLNYNTITLSDYINLSTLNLYNFVFVEFPSYEKSILQILKLHNFTQINDYLMNFDNYNKLNTLVISFDAPLIPAQPLHKISDKITNLTLKNIAINTASFPARLHELTLIDTVKINNANMISNPTTLPESLKKLVINIEDYEIDFVNLPLNLEELHLPLQYDIDFENMNKKPQGLEIIYF
jgi:hypothetical protein